MTSLGTPACGATARTGDRSRPRAALPALCATQIVSRGIVSYAFPVGHLKVVPQRHPTAPNRNGEARSMIGWTYRRLLPLDDILAANSKWLAGHRHPRNAGRPGLAEAVLAAFTRPRPLIEGAEVAGDPIEALPDVFHALWQGQLTACLDTPLHERVPVGPRGWSGPERGGIR